MHISMDALSFRDKTSSRHYLQTSMLTPIYVYTFFIAAACLRSHNRALIRWHPYFGGDREDLVRMVTRSPSNEILSYQIYGIEFCIGYRVGGGGGETNLGGGYY